MSKDLKEYFNKMPRLDALATASRDGKVNIAYFGQGWENSKAPGGRMSGTSKLWRGIYDRRKRNGINTLLEME
jgi:hypothetical protein